MLRTSRVIVVLHVLLGTVSSCKYTAEDIEEWKGTRRGPGKIVAVLLADKYPVDLRVRAGMALIEMNREDVQPLKELQAAFRHLAPEDRTGVLRGMIPALETILRAPPAERGPTPQQVRAKDAGFVLLEFTTGPERTRMEDALLTWVTADFNGRFLMGEHSADKIVRQVGPRAARALVATLTPEQLAIEKISELIVEIGDPPTRAAAAAQLVQTATAQQAQPQGLRERTLVAMHKVGGRPIVDYVLALVSQPLPADPAAARAMLQGQILGMRAVQGHLAPTDIERLFAIATTKTLRAEIRDEAFERIAELRTPEALPRLWPLLDDDDERVRWRAGDLILASGGSAVVKEFLNKLPAGRTEYPERETGSYVDAVAAMNPVPLQVLRGMAVSESWIARYISVRVLAQRGAREDVPLLQQLVADRTKVPGRTPAITIGDEARNAVQRLQGG